MAFDNGTLGTRIKSCRQAAGISQEKVAELVGVSRQAVTKWETGQSAPSTENLFRLAEIFGTTVDLILTADSAGDDRGKEAEGCGNAAGGVGNTGMHKPQQSIAEQMYELQKLDEARRAEEQRQQRLRNLRACLAVMISYIVYYLAGRVLCVHYEHATVMGWLFVNDWRYIDYMYGWLLSSNLFWYAAVVSAVPSLFGKWRFSAMTVVAFGGGWLLGEFFGPNPEGVPLGHDHYGWAIWICVFLAGIAVGAVWQRVAGKSER